MPCGRTLHEFGYGRNHPVPMGAAGHDTVEMIRTVQVKQPDLVPRGGCRRDIGGHQGGQLCPDEKLANPERQVVLRRRRPIVIGPILRRAPHERYNHRLATDRLIHPDQGCQGSGPVEGHDGRRNKRCHAETRIRSRLSGRRPERQMGTGGVPHDHDA